MSNQTAARDSMRKDGVLVAYSMAAVKIWDGSAVCLNSAGYAKGGAPVAGERFLGVAVGTVDNAAGSVGDKDILVSQCGIHRFGATGMAATDVGKNVWLGDDQTVQFAPTAIYAGVIREVISATVVSVDIKPGVETKRIVRVSACVAKTSLGSDYDTGYVAHGNARVLAIHSALQVKPVYATSCVLAITKRKTADQTDKNLLAAASWDMQAEAVVAGKHAVHTVTTTSADLDLVLGDQLYIKSTGTGEQTTAGQAIGVTFEIAEG